MNPERKLIFDANVDTSDQVWIQRNHIWTPEDNDVCKKGEESGLLINNKTQQPSTFEELKSLTIEYDKKKHHLIIS